MGWDKRGLGALLLVMFVPFCRRRARKDFNTEAEKGGPRSATEKQNGASPEAQSFPFLLRGTPWSSLSASVLESSFACHAIAGASRGTRMRRVVESKRFGRVRSIDKVRGPGVADTVGADMVVRRVDFKC